MPAKNDIDLEKVVSLPRKTHGEYSYPETLVSMERSHFNKNWDDAHQALIAEGAYMLTIRQFVDFLSLLRSGNAFDGRGQSIDASKLIKIYNEITEVRGPWRSEWLDAKFAIDSKGIFGLKGKTRVIKYNYINDAGSLVTAVEPLSNDTLLEDKTPGIDISQWLSTADPYGLPTKLISRGQLYYWYPKDKRVAGFNADSDGAYLSCGRNPTISDPRLGVRAARKKV